MFSETFSALLKEAQFTREMLGSGATQIRYANYASKGVYFQAFTSLSTGLERIGKLCLMLDYYIDHQGSFPASDYVKREICHNIDVIYEKGIGIVAKRAVAMRFLHELSDPVHQAILSVLSGFARGDRYSNVDLLVGGRRLNDPVAVWFRTVDQPIYETRVSTRKKEIIKRNAAAIGQVLSDFASVHHTSETGEEITDVERASHMTGIYESVAPYRQLYVCKSFVIGSNF